MGGTKALANEELSQLRNNRDIGQSFFNFLTDGEYGKVTEKEREEARENAEITTKHKFASFTEQLDIVKDLSYSTVNLSNTKMTLKDLEKSLDSFQESLNSVPVAKDDNVDQKKTQHHPQVTQNGKIIQRKPC